MVVILAGYTAPMKKLLESNEGIESRFPNVFNFEDYTTEELLEIGKLMIRKQGFNLTKGAEQNMMTIIQTESEKPSHVSAMDDSCRTYFRTRYLRHLGQEHQKWKTRQPKISARFSPRMS